MNTKYYNIKNTISFSIIGKQPTDFVKKMNPWLCDGNSSSLSFYFNQDIAADKIINGNYKGIRWRIGVKDLSAERRISFSSLGFTSFLFQRLVFLPVIKRELVNAGGFSFLGSCFKYRNSLFLLSGMPGSGKTTLLLDAVKQGAEFVGDNEIAVFPDGTVAPIFEEIELRYQTAKQSLFWNRLSIKVKSYLYFSRILSAATFGRICLNQICTPVELGLYRKDVNLNDKINFIYLNGEGRKKNEGKEMILYGVETYERGYQEIYGNRFFNEDDLGSSLSSMSDFLNICQCWKMPLNTRFSDLAKTENL